MAPREWLDGVRVWASGSRGGRGQPGGGAACALDGTVDAGVAGHFVHRDDHAVVGVRLDRRRAMARSRREFHARGFSVRRPVARRRVGRDVRRGTPRARGRRGVRAHDAARPPRRCDHTRGPGAGRVARGAPAARRRRRGVGRPVAHAGIRSHAVRGEMPRAGRHGRACRSGRSRTSWPKQAC